MFLSAVCGAKCAKPPESRFLRLPLPSMWSVGLPGARAEGRMSEKHRRFFLRIEEEFPE